LSLNRINYCIAGCTVRELILYETDECNNYGVFGSNRGSTTQRYITQEEIILLDLEDEVAVFIELQGPPALVAAIVRIAGKYEGR
jgi:hypothetical protein